LSWNLIQPEFIAREGGGPQAVKEDLSAFA